MNNVISHLSHLDLLLRAGPLLVQRPSVQRNEVISVHTSKLLARALGVVDEPELEGLLPGGTEGGLEGLLEKTNERAKSVLGVLEK